MDFNSEFVGVTFTLACVRRRPWSRLLRTVPSLRAVAEADDLDSNWQPDHDDGVADIFLQVLA